MGKGGKLVEVDQPASSAAKTLYTWDEVKEHTSREDKWFVIDGEVYDVTKWTKSHPGGSRVISHFAGQDASEAFRAFHCDPGSVRKRLAALHVGHLEDTSSKEELIKTDMEELRKTAEKMGLFRPSMTFFALVLAHLVILEVLGYLTLSYFGTGWVPYLLTIVILAAAQAQGGWAQHDYGHLSVFKGTKLNRWGHYLTMCILKGAGMSWWQHLHLQHHAKPNVIDKDPDVRLEKVFVLGKEQPKRAAKNKKSMPYNFQNYYFFMIGPPLLFPIYFQYMVFNHTITRKLWGELAFMLIYYARMMYLYMPILGVWQTCLFYFFIRALESHWFVWVSQSNHIPMEISEDKNRPWLPLQLYATCDIEKSYFNDWFTGHLNFQIEHHLFPTMPRHNLYKIASTVKKLCEKHNIPYQTKTLGGSFADIVRTLKSSGEIWATYYQAYHGA